MHRQSFPNFIIISGSGRNVGKTWLAAALIRQFSVEFPVVALKISPHVHDSSGSAELIADTGGSRIFREILPNLKNSGRFLEAGAAESYFMETDDAHLPEAFQIFLNKCNRLKYPVICESGALTRLVKPGISFFILRESENLPAHKAEIMRLADVVLPAQIFFPPAIIDMVNFTGNSWSWSTPGESVSPEPPPAWPV
jgi:hypothetical protein